MTEHDPFQMTPDEIAKWFSGSEINRDTAHDALVWAKVWASATAVATVIALVALLIAVL